MSIIMSPALERHLIDDGIPSNVVQALRVAMANSGVNAYAKAYAHGVEAAYVEFGIEGVYTQILYLLNNMSRWKGEEARETKKILRSWKPT